MKIQNFQLAAIFRARKQVILKGGDQFPGALVVGLECE